MPCSYVQCLIMPLSYCQYTVENMCLSLYKRSGHNNLLSDKSFSKVRRIASGSRLANPAEYIHPISAKLHNQYETKPHFQQVIDCACTTYSRVLEDECLFFSEKVKSGCRHFLHGGSCQIFEGVTIQNSLPTIMLTKNFTFHLIKRFLECQNKRET